MRITLALIMVLSSCKSGSDGMGSELPSGPISPLLEVPESESWAIDGMVKPGFVIRTEMNIPHVYAYNLGDLGRIEGFTYARPVLLHGPGPPPRQGHAVRAAR